MSHRTRPFASNKTCQIEYCDHCDVMHVTVGPVTLRLQLATAGQLCHALAESIGRISAIRDLAQVNATASTSSN